MDFSKPRVAVYYDVLPQTGFRNDGMPLFINYNLRKIIDGSNVLEDAKLIRDDSKNVVHLSPLTPREQHGTFDLNILVDYGEDALNIPLDWEIPHPNAYWAADTHLGYEYRLKRAKQFDHVFLCHKAQIPQMIKDGIAPDKIHYLPCAAEPDCYKPYPVIKKWKWCFIGHFNSDHRIDLIDRFVKEFGLGDGKGYLGWRFPQQRGHNVLDDAAKKYAMSQFVINDAIREDQNMRIWESMASGSMLITQRINGIEDFFEDGKDLVLYDSIDEAIKKANYYLSNSEERESIAQSGLKRILSGHTYADRTKAILDVCLPGWRSSVSTCDRDVPEYDLNGSLVPSSGVYYHPSSHLRGEQSRLIEEGVPNV
jgi:glycosyltransferase involved in cell wall biosynthesis